MPVCRFNMMRCDQAIHRSAQKRKPESPAAFAGTDAAQEVDGGANAPLLDGGYPITPAEEIKRADKHPVNASLLTMLLLSLSFGASVLWMLTNDRRRRAGSCCWGVEDRPWLAVAYEGSSFLGVFLL
jgi:hypothetical protein